MAQAISIGASKKIDELKTELSRDLRCFENHGYTVKMEINPQGKLTFLRCQIQKEKVRRGNEEYAKALFKRYVAQAVSDVILCHWEKQLLLDIIQENYYYFSEAERNSIYHYAAKAIQLDQEEQKIPSAQWLQRRDKILQELLAFLQSSDNIVIEGFIRFRLKAYLQELQEVADQAVDDFLLEREYKEFIQLLQYFVDVQDTQVDKVHVLLKANGVFQLYDAQHEAIDSAYLEEFMLELMGNEINYEDMLISALITLAPEEIEFHLGQGHPPRHTLETIQNVFGDKVKECAGCTLCKLGVEKN